MAKETIYTVGGTIQPGMGVYIRRKADDELLELCQAGEFAFILSSRQVGKSSLMTQTARKLKELNIRSASVDLSNIGTRIKQEEWYLGIMHVIATDLELKTDIFTYWSQYSGLGSSQRFFNFLRDVLLTEIQDKVVLFFDEIDTTLSIDFADDFFATVRAAYNARAATPEFNRLSFVLVGVATPGDLISDSKRTPFNVGRRVELNDFTLEEALPLAQGLGENAEQVLKWILEWTGGHPYLTQRLCEQISKSGEGVDEPAVARLVEQLYLGEQGQQDNNLQFVRDLLVKRSPDTRRVMLTYGDIRLGKRVTDDERSIVKAYLKISGIARRQAGLLVTRNKIYERVFDPKWVKDHTPSAVPRRIMLGSALAVLLALFVAVYFAYQDYTRTDAERAAQYTADFQAATAVRPRLKSLAGLFTLKGFSSEARILFDQLPKEEKLLLFVPARSRSDKKYQVIVVKGLYQSMANTEEGMDLLQAMKETVKDENPPSNLYDEMTAWVNGRKELNEKDYYSAEAHLKVAIENNPGNPSVYYDLAQVHIGMEKYPEALDDLADMINLDKNRGFDANGLFQSNPQFYRYWLDHKEEEKYAVLAKAITIPMVLIPAGEFTMGSTSEQINQALAQCQIANSNVPCPSDSFADEEPAHRVSVDAFYIDQYEVTNARYSECVAAGVCNAPSGSSSFTHASYYGNPEFDNHPVINVSWFDASTYCQWRGARLPTEAEWEKAARGNDGRLYPWGNEFDGTRVNFCDTNCTLDWANKNYDDGFADISPVGTYENGKSPYGVYDMAGNVWEWVADWYGGTYYSNSPSENPPGPDSGTSRVLRGGAWDLNGSGVRSANRDRNDPASTISVIGFRCSRSQ